MNVLSLFDGISCGRIALERAGINVDKYYASEIDNYAIQISKKNYPDIIHIGDVTHIDCESLPKIDLLIGGSPCQDLSIAKQDRKGLNGERSGLFYEYVRILKTIKPKYFLLENVASMTQQSKSIISKELDVEPILINSSLVSGQQRNRLYWTNIENIVKIETNKNTIVKDILQECTQHIIKCVDKDIVYTYNNKINTNRPIQIGYKKSNSQGNRIYSIDGKSMSLSTSCGGLFKIDECIRKLTPIECERLQTLPDNYTEGISSTQRYRCIGNGWTVDVISFILKHIKKDI